MNLKYCFWTMLGQSFMLMDVHEDQIFGEKSSLYYICIKMGTTVLLKWTPNGLMDASGPAPFPCSDSNVSQSKVNFANPGTRKISPVSWQQAISINIATVLYIHCHQVSRHKYLTVLS